MPRTIDIAGLVADFHVDVYRYAYRLSGATADAEDIAQETFLVAQQKLDQLRDIEKARGWLLAIARTTFLKSKRRRRPATAGVAVDLNTVAEKSPPDHLDGEDLQQALDELPDEFRTVVLMFYFEFRPYRDIAEQLDLPIGTVMSRLSRAKSHLRRRLTAAEENVEENVEEPGSGEYRGGSAEGLNGGSVKNRNSAQQERAR